jgi:hypothetical protein
VPSPLGIIATKSGGYPAPKTRFVPIPGLVCGLGLQSPELRKRPGVFSLTSLQRGLEGETPRLSLVNRAISPSGSKAPPFREGWLTISPSHSQAQWSCNAIELAFLNDSLVCFIGIFNPILIVITFRRQELRNLINAVRAPATEGSGHEAHRLTDFEFMPVHEAPHHVQRLCAPPCRWNRATSIVCFIEILYHEIA